MSKNKNLFETQEINLESLRRSITMNKVGKVFKDVRAVNLQEVILIVRGVVERRILNGDKVLILGRMSNPDLDDDAIYVDLSSYGASERGVSRRHAQIHFENEYLMITDLESTNGTYLAGERLTPDVPTRIVKGNELALSQLPIQVLFR